jgi:hypothetical protein
MHPFIHSGLLTIPGSSANLFVQTEEWINLDNTYRLSIGYDYSREMHLCNFSPKQEA